jgi:hypothetical protein
LKKRLRIVRENFCVVLDCGTDLEIPYFLNKHENFMVAMDVILNSLYIKDNTGSKKCYYLDKLLQEDTH